MQQYSAKGFLEYLYSLGYKVYEFTNEPTKEIPMPTNWSTYGVTEVWLYNGVNKIRWGIAEGLSIQTAPTLRHPMPVQKCNIYNKEEIAIDILKTFPPERIYEAMFTDNKIQYARN